MNIKSYLRRWLGITPTITPHYQERKMPKNSVHLVTVQLIDVQDDNEIFYKQLAFRSVDTADQEIGSIISMAFRKGFCYAAFEQPASWRKNESLDTISKSFIETLDSLQGLQPNEINRVFGAGMPTETRSYIGGALLLEATIVTVELI